MWTREEDMQHDVYRPAYRDVIAASLKDGKIVAWKYKIAGSSIMARWMPPAFVNGSTSMRSIAPSTCLTNSEPAGSICARRAAGRAHRLLARRRTE